MPKLDEVLAENRRLIALGQQQAAELLLLNGIQQGIGAASGENDVAAISKN